MSGKWSAASGVGYTNAVYGQLEALGALYCMQRKQKWIHFRLCLSGPDGFQRTHPHAPLWISHRSVVLLFPCSQMKWQQWFWIESSDRKSSVRSERKKINMWMPHSDVMSSTSCTTCCIWYYEPLCPFCDLSLQVADACFFSKLKCRGGESLKS